MNYERSGYLMIPVKQDDIIQAFREAMMGPYTSFDDVVNMIVGLDLACEDWEVTEQLIAHFKALEVEMMKEEQCGPVEPKKIKL